MIQTECSICNSQYNLLEEDHHGNIISCHDHSFHVACFYSWHQTWGFEEDLLETCMICHERLEMEESAKLCNVTTGSRYKLYDEALKNRAEPFQRLLDKVLTISPGMFIRLVTESLDRGLMSTAACLKKNQDIHITSDVQKLLLVSMFRDSTPARMCWVLNRFDLDYTKGLSGGKLDWFLLRNFIETEAYNELYTIVMNDFADLDDFLLTEIGTTLFLALKTQPGKLTYCLSTTQKEPHRIFEEFCKVCPERSGFIYSEMFAHAMRVVEDDLKRENSKEVLKVPGLKSKFEPVMLNQKHKVTKLSEVLVASDLDSDDDSDYFSDDDNDWDSSESDQTSDSISDLVSSSESTSSSSDSLPDLVDPEDTTPGTVPRPLYDFSLCKKYLIEEHPSTSHVNTPILTDESPSLGWEVIDDQSAY